MSDLAILQPTLTRLKLRLQRLIRDQDEALEEEVAGELRNIEARIERVYRLALEIDRGTVRAGVRGRVWEDQARRGLGRVGLEAGRMLK
jgi:hypothetical protein